MQPLVLGPVSVSTRTLTGQGIGFLETLKNPVNLFKNNLNKTRNNMKSEIQKKKKVELLIQYQHFSKKSFSCLKGQKNYGEVVLDWRTNDQIMPWFGEGVL